MIGSSTQYTESVRSWDLNSEILLEECINLQMDLNNQAMTGQMKNPPSCLHQEDAEKMRTTAWTENFTYSLTKSDMHADMYEYYTTGTGQEAVKPDLDQRVTPNVCDADGFSSWDSDSQDHFYGPPRLPDAAIVGTDSHQYYNYGGQCYSGQTVNQNQKSAVQVKVENISPGASPQQTFCQTQQQRPLSKAGRKRRECLQDLQLSKSELDRKERRRAQNRSAAEKCRKKKKAQQARILEDYQKTQTAFNELKQQVLTLEKQRLHLEQQLNNHLAVCPIHHTHH